MQGIPKPNFTRLRSNKQMLEVCFKMKHGATNAIYLSKLICNKNEQAKSLNIIGAKDGR